MNRDYEFIKKNIEHYKAVGEERIYISDYDNYQNHPWSEATSLEGGGSWRLDIPVSMYFKVEYKGVEIRWSFDLEQKNANGKGIFHFDNEKIKWVFDQLTPDMKQKFAIYLETTVVKSVKKQCKEVFESYLTLQKTETVLLNLIDYGKGKK